ncbi:MAG TPA: mechanosensitive ion channel family protein [Wenzhouxiangella sp.]
MSIFADLSIISAPEWLPKPLMDAWVLLADYPVVQALVTLILGLALAFAARFVVLFWARRIRQWTRSDLADGLANVLASLATSVLVYLTLALVVDVLGFEERVTEILIRVLSTLLILKLMRVAMQAGSVGLQILSHIRERFSLVEERTLPLFDLVLTVAVIGVAAYALLLVWDINPAAWLASAGVVGIAVGFAAKDTLANLFAGFFIIADRPYKLGDYVVLDTGDRGEVTRVGIRSTRILTRDDVEITVPNSEMANTKIFNESGGRWERFRIRIKVGVAYGSDVDQVVAVLEQVANEQAKVCREPAPRVRMRGFGDSSLDFELLCWVEHPVERGLVSHELYMQIYKALANAKIEIPFPQRDVWMRQSPEFEDGTQGA